MPTASYLENAGLYYVQRYAATTASLRRVLQNRVRKAQQAYPDFNPAPCAAWIDAVIERFVRLGYVNDAAYAEAKVASLRRKGASAQKIQAKLREKGVTADIDRDDESEMAAAMRYVKRKRLGVFRTRAADDAKQKDMAALARAGFSRSVAARALQLTQQQQADQE